MAEELRYEMCTVSFCQDLCTLCFSQLKSECCFILFCIGFFFFFNSSKTSVCSASTTEYPRNAEYPLADPTVTAIQVPEKFGQDVGLMLAREPPSPCSARTAALEMW